MARNHLPHQGQKLLKRPGEAVTALSNCRKVQGTFSGDGSAAAVHPAYVLLAGGVVHLEKEQRCHTVQQLLHKQK